MEPFEGHVYLQGPISVLIGYLFLEIDFELLLQ